MSASLAGKCFCGGHVDGSMVDFTDVKVVGQHSLQPEPHYILTCANCGQPFVLKFALVELKGLDKPDKIRDKRKLEEYLRSR